MARAVPLAPGGVSMASWYYAYNGEQRGPVDDAELKMLEQQGVIKASTLVWCEGMADWQTLAETQGRPRPSTTAAPMMSSAPAQAPLPQQPSVGPYNPSPYAAPPSPYGDAPVYPNITVDEEPEGPAWENVYTPVHVRAWETAKTCLLNPSEFFATMRREGDYTQPMYFAALLAFVSTLVSAVWQVPMQVALAAAGMSATGGGTGGGASGVELGAVAGQALMGSCCGSIGAGIGVAIGSFVGAGIYHVVLSMVGGANRSYETTFRVVAYVNGATALLNIIPCYLGSLVAPFWAIVLLVIGLAKAHETDTWKGAVAVLGPVLLCCLAIGGLAIAFGAAIMAAVSQSGGGGF